MKRLKISHLPFISVLISIIFLGASCNEPKDGGIFRSLDGGESWDPKNYVGQQGRKVITINDLTISAITIHPQDPNIIYIGTQGSGLYVTLDGGEQWYSTKLKSGTINSVEVDPQDPKIVYVGGGTKVLRTKDEGENWETVLTDVKGARINEVVVDTYEHNRVYAVTSGGAVYKSYDYGDNWDLRLQTSNSISEMLMASYDTRILYIRTAAGNLIKTTQGGEPVIGEEDTNTEAELVNTGWKRVIPTEEQEQQFEGLTEIYDVAMDPSDNKILYVATDRGLMRSTDEGQTWSDFTTLLAFQEEENKSVRHITIAPTDPNIIYFVVNHAIHKSIDGGNTWQVLNTFPSSRNISEFAIDYEANNVLYIGTQYVKKKGGLLSPK